MNSSTRLLEALLSRGDYLERFSRDELRAMLPVLERAHEEILGKIAKTGGEWTRAWLGQMAEDIRAIYDRAIIEAGGQLMSSLEGLARDEAEWAGKQLDAVMMGVSSTTPAPSLMWATMQALPLADGSTLGSLLEALGVNSTKAVTEAVQAGMLEGETIQQMTRRLRGEVVKRASWRKGEDGVRRYVPGVYKGGAMENVTTRQAEALARTATMHVANQARDSVYEANTDIIKGFQRVETLDTATCIPCGVQDGRVYKMDEPRPALPAHIGCLPGDALVSSGSSISAVSKRKYQGDMFVIRAASGKEVRATPNHPILTRQGFVAAQFLNFGDELVCDAGIDRVCLIGIDNNQVESSIEDLFGAFLEAGKVAPMKVPTTTEDFHGDGTNDEIAVIAANRELLNEIYSESAKVSSESILVRRRREFVTLESSNRGQCQLRLGLLASERRTMGRARESLAFFRACSAHALKLLFVRVSQGYSSLTERLEHICTGSSKQIGDPPDPDSRVVRDEHLVEGRPNLGSSANLEDGPLLSDPLSNNLGTHPALSGEIIDGLAGPISFEKIIDIRKEYFSGHVYNLQTEDGYFIANGIITHNCRGLYVPVLKSWREMGIDADEVAPGTRASMDGQVAESETWADRIAKASPERRKAMLGPSRARLYERGLPLEAMIDGNRVIPLDEIEMPKAKRGAA